ncbi:MAG: hypothetical protein H6606_03335 [Flavobacteriales bacterium]|nr:hypothetical protein [Flavobacteriales bacterium]
MAPLFLILIAFVLYGNTLSHQFAFDDAIVITENQHTLRGLEGIPDLVSTDFFTGIYGAKGMELTGGRYRPLSLVCFAIENQLFGKAVPGPTGTTYQYNPRIGHLLNVLFFAFTCVLLFLLIRRWFPGSDVIAWVCCLLFLVHPVHTEVVANIKSRDEILALFFLLLSLLLLDRQVKGRNGIGNTLLMGLTFLLAMLSKENAFTYVAVVPLILWTIYKLTFGSTIRSSSAFWIVAILYLVLRTTMVGLPSTTETNPSILENPFVNSAFSEKYGTISAILLRYLGLMIYPLRLACDYSYAQIPYIELGNPVSLLSLSIHIALVIALIIAARRRDVLAVAISGYLFPLSVASNLVFNVGAPMGERFIYMSSVAFLIGVAVILLRWLKWDKIQNWKKHPLGVLIVLIALLAYGVRTIDRNRDWYDNESLFTADVQTHPQSAKLHYYYANTLLKKQMSSPEKEEFRPLLDSAFVHFRKSVEIYPAFQIGWYNVGLTLVQQEKGSEALPYIERSLQLNPNHGISLALLGQVYGRYLNEPRKALGPLLRSIREFGLNEAGILQNTGICYAILGNSDSAVYYFDQALLQKPGDRALLDNKMKALLQSGRLDEAGQIQRLLSNAPADGSN